MATNYIYPFTKGSELKKVVSQMDLSYDIDNIEGSMLMAANDIKEFISEDVWDMLMAYFNTGKYEATGEEGNDPDKDKSFRLLRLAHGNLTMFHHMPFATVQISGGGITTKKGDTETTAFKYQTDAIEAKLQQAAFSGLGELIKDLSKNAYQEWSDSDQFKEVDALIFDGYRDFNKAYGIDNDAVFYMRIRHIIEEKTDTILRGRIAIPDMEAYILKLAKKAIAYYSIAEAVMQFDLSVLPSPIRRTINNENQKRGSEKDLILKKENLRNLYDRTADSFVYTLDQELSKKEAATDEEKETVFDKYKTELNASDPSVTIL